MSTVPALSPTAPMEHHFDVGPGVGVSRLGGFGSTGVGRSLNNVQSAKLPPIGGYSANRVRFPMSRSVKSFAAATQMQGDAESGGGVLSGPIPANGIPGLGGASEKGGLGGLIEKITHDKKLLVAGLVALAIIAFLFYRYVIKRGKGNGKRKKRR